jgi:predicted lipoprotein with Yx(FWY)xxD motif
MASVRRRAVAIPGERPRRLPVKLLGALAAVALTAAACGSSSASTTTTHAAAASGSDQVAVKTATVNGKTALVDSKGWTLYTFSLDKPGNIACTGGCTKIWPPLLVPAGKHLSMSMSGLGTETRPGGEVQVTYKGSPLYTYSGDTGPAQDHGVTIPHWFIASTSASSSSTTTSTSSSGGYGY